MYKVSVIVPVYNLERYIGKCLESLVIQTLTDYEIIIVDDGSTDGGNEVIEKYHALYPNIIKVIRQNNSGVSCARNNAMSIAKGEYIAYVDGDDYVDKDYLEKLYCTALDYHSDMVFCGYKMVDTQGNVLSVYSPEINASESEAVIYKMMTICMRMIKRDFLLEHNNRFPEGVRGEDIPYNMLINALGKNIKAIDYVGYYYVQHKSSAMKKMKGLKEIKLPVDAIADTYEYIMRNNIRNSKDYLELSIARSYAFFLFIFGRKSNKKELFKLCDSIEQNIKRMNLKFNKNSYISLFKPKQFPVVHRMAVWLFTKLYMMRMLKPIAFLITRF